MPKIQKHRAKYHDRAPPLNPDAEEEPVEGEEATGEAEDGPAPVVMGRRRQKRREDFLRKFEFVNYVQQQDEVRRSGGALADLGGLGQALSEPKGSDSSGKAAAQNTRPPGRKARAAAGEREMVQYQGVLGCEAFKKDPLGALEQHLRNGLQRQQQQQVAGEAAGSAPARGKRQRGSATTTAA